MKQEGSDAQRGRPAAFDRDAVIARAMTVFWTDGFEGATLSRLEEATGVDRSTLYNSFGGKAGLYASAASAYVDQIESELFGILVGGDASDLSDVVEFLEHLAASIESTEYPPGCLIVNDLGCAERCRASTTRYVTALEAGISAAFHRSTLPVNDRAARTKSFAAAVIGVNAVAQHDQPTSLAMIEALKQDVRRWIESPSS